MPIIPVPAAMQASTRGFYPKTINGSLRFNDDDSAYLSWTPASAGNRKTWTWSGWVKLGSLSGTQDQILFNAYSGASAFFILGMRNGQFYWYDINGPDYGGFYSPLYRDPSSWYHVVFSFNSSGSWTTKLYVNGVDISSTFLNDYGTPSAEYEAWVSQTIQHNIGVRLDSGGIYSDGYLAEVFFIDGTAHTASDFGETKNGVWVPKNVTATDFTMGTNGFHLTFEDDTQVEAFNTVLYRGTGAQQSITGTGFTPDLIWTKNRTAAFSHFLIDSVRGREKYLNSNSTGAEVTATNRILSFDSDGFTVGDAGGSINGSGNQLVAWAWDAGANNAVTGHSSVTYTGNGGTQKISGFPFSPDLVWLKSRDTGTDPHLLFDTVRGAGIDSHANNTEAEHTNSNTLTSFDKDGFILGGSGYTNGSSENFVAWAWDAGDSDPVSNTAGSITSTVKSSGDFSIISYTGNGTTGSTVGHGLSSTPDFIITKRTNTTGNWAVWSPALSGNTYSLLLNGTNAEFVPTDANYTPQNNTSSVYGLGFNSNTNSSGSDYICYAWRNVTGKQKFGTYTGNGSATGPTVTTGFRPGWLMIKRTDTTSNWLIYDTSRTPFNPNDDVLFANTSGAEDGTSDDIEFTSTGFQLKEAASSTNASGGTYIYAAFAGSYSDYITDYNTDGSIDSRVKASDTTGFSICSYTGNGSSGATVGHGLSSAPDWIVTHRRDSTSSWRVYHSALGATKMIELHTTGAAETNGVWANTAPTSSVFSLSSFADVNASGGDYIAYCWTATTNRSAFGSYTGNGSTSGPTVTLGWQPAWVIIKKTDGAGVDGWFIIDNTRDTDNVANKRLAANSSDAEGTDLQLATFSSTGFQITYSGQAVNQSGTTYIYAAFADTREAAFWLDQSGNDNDWQPNNLDHNDTVSDSPTNNFATLNPLSPTALTLSDGNLKASLTSATKDKTARGTIGVSSGKWYFEGTLLTDSTGAGVIGIVDASDSDVSYVGYSSSAYGYYANGNKINGDSFTAYGSSYSAGDVIGVAFDLDAGNITFYKNGVSQGVAFTGLTGTKHLAVASGGFTNIDWVINAGQQPFKYDPPE